MRFAEPQDADQLPIHVQLAARDAECSGDGEEEPLLCRCLAAEGGVVSAEELLERAWDQSADPFTNAVRITVSGLRKRLGEPWIVTTVPGVGYRIDAGADAMDGGGERG